MESIDPDPLTELESIIRRFVRGEISLPGSQRERGALEAKLNILPGHLDRLTAFVREGDVYVERVGDYLVVLNQRMASLCLVEVFWSIAPELERYVRPLMAIIGSQSIIDAHLSCRVSVFGLVAGLDYDSGKAFIHALPAPQASILSVVDGGLSEDLVRLAMGFHLHRWEPWALQPSEGVRVRLQGDVVAEYATVFGGSRDAVEAARSYEAFQRGVAYGVYKALEAARDLASSLEAGVGEAGEGGVAGAVRAWLEENRETLIPPGIIARVTRPVGRREPSWAPLRVVVDFRRGVGRLREDVALDAVRECRLSNWKSLRASYGCVLIALREAVGRLDLNIPVTGPGRPIILWIRGLLNIAAGIAAEASQTLATGLQPGKIEASVGDHRIVAEEGVVVEAPEAVLLHSLARRLKAIDSTDGEELAKAIQRGERRLSPSNARALLEALSLDVSSHVIVLTRPQRLTLEHREHGRATMEVGAPAAIILGSLKSADALRLRSRSRAG